MADADDIYLDDNERAERVRTWWKQNGPAIAGGAVLGLIAIFGWRAWQDHMAAHRQAAAGAYQEFITQSQSLSAEQVAERMSMFKSDFGDTPYAAMAALDVASLAYEAKRPEQAADYYRYAIEQGQPEGVATVARLRLARLQMDQGQYEQALATLEVPAPGAFQSLIAELKGDIYVHQGKIEAARAAYQSALTQADPVATRFIELKLSALGSGILAPPVNES